MSDTNIYKWAEQSLPNDGAGGSVCIKVVAPIYAFPSSPQFSLAAWAVDIPVLIFAIIVSLISGLELLWSGWNGGLAIFFIYSFYGFFLDNSGLCCDSVTVMSLVSGSPSRGSTSDRLSVFL